MANELDFDKIIKGLPLTAKGFKELHEQLNKVVTLFIKGQKVFDNTSKNQGDVTKKTKQLSVAQKELIKLDKQLERAEVQLTEEYKQVQKALLKKKEAVRQSNAELKKQAGLTKQQTSFTKKMGAAISSSILKITAGIAAASGVIKIVKGVINSTQTAGDQLAATIGAIKGGWDAASKSFGNTKNLKEFIQNVKDGISAGREYVKVLDDLSDRTRDLQITQSEARVEIAKLKQVVDNVNLSNEKRIEAAKKINKLETDILKQTQSVRKQAFDAEVNRLAALTGFQNEQILNFIKNYDEESELREKAQLLISKETELRRLEAKRVNDYYLSNKNNINNAKKDIENYISSLSDSEKQYIEIYKSYSKTTDDELDKVTQAYVALQGAEESFLSGTRRSNNQLNTLTKQINKERIKSAEETSKEIKRIEVETFKFQMQAKEARIESVATEDSELLASYKVYLDEKKKLKEKADAEDLASTEEFEEAKTQLKSEIEAAAIQITTDLFNAGVDDRLNKYLEANESEQEILKNKLDKGLISESKYESQISKLKVKARQEEAKADKKKALFDIAINTLVGAVKALPNIPLSIIITGIGLAQAAVVAAKPIPKFRMGVQNFDGGLADVHTGEIIKTQDGSMFKTPIGETRMYLPPATDVIPAHKAEPIIKEVEKSNMELEVLKSIDNKLSRQNKNISATWTHKGLRVRDYDNNMDRTYINKYR